MQRKAPHVNDANAGETELHKTAVGLKRAYAKVVDIHTKVSDFFSFHRRFNSNVNTEPF